VVVNLRSVLALGIPQHPSVRHSGAIRYVSGPRLRASSSGDELTAADPAGPAPDGGRRARGAGGGCLRGSIAERLAIGPSAPPFPLSSQPPPGELQPLGQGDERDGVFVAPPGAGPAPLLVMLHGAGGTGRRAANMIFALAEQRGCMVLAPDSRGTTWDAITGRFGPDVQFLERALRETLPRIFVSHGRQDPILPIDSCSRRLVPLLRGARYDVRYREFDGEHEVPTQVKQDALDWFIGVPA